MIRIVHPNRTQCTSSKTGSPVRQTQSMHLMCMLQKSTSPSPTNPSLGHRSSHRPYQAFRRCHHDAKQRHHSTRIYHASIAETPQRHPAKTCCYRRGRSNTGAPVAPPSASSSKKDANGREITMRRQHHLIRDIHI
jgi:hypothetical protein